VGGEAPLLLVALQVATGKRRHRKQAKEHSLYEKSEMHDSLLPKFKVISAGIIPDLPVHARIFTLPVAPSTRRRWPGRRRRWTSGGRATGGKPNSGATIAPCDSTPPVSMTSPLACTNSGTQAGSVDGHTSMNGSPGSDVVGCSSTRAMPSATPADSGTPC